MARTGYKAYTTLEEYDTLTGLATGNTKPNIDSDPDYVAPILDELACPIGAEYIKIATLDTSRGSQTINFIFESTVDFIISIRTGNDFTGAEIYRSLDLNNGDLQVSISQSNPVASIFIEMVGPDYDKITKFGMSGAYITSADFNEMTGLIDLQLDQSSIPVSHNLQFTSLSVSQCLSLEKIVIKQHKMASINLTQNTLLSYIDVSQGPNLSSLNINWVNLKTLIIHDCLFTSSSYSSTFIDGVITNFNNIVPSSSTGYLLQYGLTNNLGVKPSPNVLSQYNSIISKGGTVIGKSPEVITSSNLTLEYGRSQDFIWFGLTLTNELPVDILVRVRGTYRSLGFLEAFIENITITAGQNQAYQELYVGNPIDDVTANIQSVSPNPAGGITVIY